MNSSVQAVYCFDTSAFIDSWRRYYLPEFDFCKPVWDRIEELMSEGKIIIPEEVITELKDKDDDIYKFVKRYPDIVMPVTDEQMDLVVDIFATHGQLIDKKKTEKYHADVLVIALAKLHKVPVITFESDNKGFGIPAVCKAHGVKPMRFQDFLKNENI